MNARVRSLLTAVGATVLLACSAPAGHAATQAGYPSVLVETNVSARPAPYLNSYWGQTLQQPGGGRQTASVKCWYNGDTATGNYTSNRWFQVLVWESADGYNVPRWLFVHASYVYNQPAGIRQCNATGSGYW